MKEKTNKERIKELVEAFESDKNCHAGFDTYSGAIQFAAMCNEFYLSPTRGFEILHPEKSRFDESDFYKIELKTTGWRWFKQTYNSRTERFSGTEIFELEEKLIDISRRNKKIREEELKKENERRKKEDEASKKRIDKCLRQYGLRFEDLRNILNMIR